MKIQKITYPDGTFYPLLPENINNHETITYRINSYEDLWFLKQIKDALDYGQVKCDLIIPCLLDGQADDRFLDNSSANLKLICNFINDMKWNSVSIFHPHNKEVVKALINNVKIIDNKEFIQNVLKNINSNNLCLLSPDAGAYKWITKLADNLKFKKEVFSASKSRKWEDGKTILTQSLDIQDFEGKDLLIVDDIIIGGGSVIGLAKMLKERNCGKLYVAASHMTIKCPNDDLWNKFEQVYTTNSKDLIYINSLGNSSLPLTIINLF